MVRLGKQKPGEWRVAGTVEAKEPDAEGCKITHQVLNAK